MANWLLYDADGEFIIRVENVSSGSRLGLEADGIRNDSWRGR